MVVAALLGGGAVAAAVALVGALGNCYVVVGHVQIRLGFDDCLVCVG